MFTVCFTKIYATKCKKSHEKYFSIKVAREIKTALPSKTFIFHAILDKLKFFDET